MKLPKSIFILIKEYQEFPERLGAGVNELINFLPPDWLERVNETEHYEDVMLPHCNKCGLISDELEEQTSMGVYAGKYCSDECWQESGYCDVGPEAFDPTYCGEQLEPDE